MLNSRSSTPAVPAHLLTLLLLLTTSDSTLARPNVSKSKNAHTYYFRPMTLEYGLKMNQDPETHLGYPDAYMYECASFGSKIWEEKCITWECHRQLETVNSAFRFQYSKNELHHLPEDLERNFINILLVSAQRNTSIRIIEIRFNRFGRKRCVKKVDDCTGYYAVLKHDHSIECPKRYIDLVKRVGK